MTMTRFLPAVLCAAACALAGCALPERAPVPQAYDFGPVTETAGARDAAQPPAPGLALRVQAISALDSPAMWYRLDYADGHELRAYSRARWAMPPAELVQQRLRQGLGAHYAILRPDEPGAQRLLLVELEEFSQQFTSPEASQGTLRLRATLWALTPSGEQLLWQRLVSVEHPAASADAAGGVRALSLATNAALAELQAWLSPKH